MCEVLVAALNTFRLVILTFLILLNVFFYLLKVTSW